jgi:hypothetical protein
MRRLLLTILTCASLGAHAPALAWGHCDPSAPPPGEPVIGDREGEASLYYSADGGAPRVVVGEESHRGYVQVDADEDGVSVHGSTKPDGELANFGVSVDTNGVHYCIGQGNEPIVEGP